VYEVTKLVASQLRGEDHANCPYGREGWGRV
jgi:hypothetical protein